MSKILKIKVYEGMRLRYKLSLNKEYDVVTVYRDGRKWGVIWKDGIYSFSGWDASGVSANQISKEIWEVID